MTRGYPSAELMDWISASREVYGASRTHRSSSTCAGPDGSLCRPGGDHPLDTRASWGIRSLPGSPRTSAPR